MSDLMTFTTPISRLVRGDIYKANDKDSNGGPLLIKTGPNKGQPTVNYYIGGAVSKTHQYNMNPQTGLEVTKQEKESGVIGTPTTYNFWQETPWGQKIMQVARMAYPQMFDPNTGLLLPGRVLALKVDDGDCQIPNTKGVANFTREGYPGHWVLNFSNGFMPQLYNANGGPMTQGDTIKRGHFIQINGTIKGGKPDSQNPSIFLNHNMVAHSGFGEEIISGPDATTVGFGEGAAPAGMSMTPVASFNPVADPMQQGGQIQQGGQVQAGQVITQQQATTGMQQPQQQPAQNPQQQQPAQQQGYQQQGAPQQQQPAQQQGYQQQGAPQQQQPAQQQGYQQQGAPQQQGQVVQANDMVQQMPAQQQVQEESYLINGVPTPRSQVLTLPGMNEAMLANLQRAQ